MGCISGKHHAVKHTEEPIDDVELNDPHPAVSTTPQSKDWQNPQQDDSPQIRMIICTISYEGSDAPLVEASKDGEHMIALAQMCGVTDLTIIKDREGTKDRLLTALADVGLRCGHDDYFIFYYCGHGSGVADDNGDEADGQDEVLLTVDEYYEISPDSVTRDDELCAAIINNVPETTRTLLLIDACNSGTIMDMNNAEWGEHREAICISGCGDNQTSAGWPDMGSLMTCSIQIAIEDFQKEGKGEYSLGEVYNAAIAAKESRFNYDGEYDQKISLQCAPNYQPGWMAWPLVPPYEYTSAATKLGY